MANTYTSLQYHIIFSTKQRHGWIQPDVEDRLWSYLGGIAKENNMRPVRTGGTKDHVHMLLGIPASIAVSDAVQMIKGGSSRWLKTQFPGLHKFGWQDGYSAFTVSKSNLTVVTDYILAQADHHRKKTFQEEYREFLEKHEIDYDERYLFD